MAAVKAQSEESKYIKRINEQMKQVFKFSKQNDISFLLQPWERAVRESGLKFKRGDLGNLIIANTKSNRNSVIKLMREINKQNAQTMRDYRKSIRNEINRDRKKGEKKATEQEINERIIQHAKTEFLGEMLDVLYGGGYGPDVSVIMRDANRSYTNFYNAVDKIDELYRRVKNDINKPAVFSQNDVDAGIFPF